MEIHDLGQARLKDVQHERIFLLALDGQTGDSRPLRAPAAESSAETLAKEIERQVHEDILASFKGRPDSTSKVARLALVGLVTLVLLVAAVAAIFLIVRALL